MKKPKFNYFKLNLQMFAEPVGEGGAGEGNNPTPAQTQQGSSGELQLDYEKIAEMVSKRTSQSQDNMLRNYLKQQGLTGEELTQAVNTFKQQKAAAEQQKAQENENIKLENQKLKAQILNSSIDNKLTALAAAEGVSAEKIPFLAKLIDRTNLADEKGNVLEDKVKEAFEAVIKAFPDFKGSQHNNNGFQQIGGSVSNSNTNAVDAQLDAIFGIKKDK